MQEFVNPNRVFQLSQGNYKEGPIVYWMQRDQRVSDNWALLYAQELAIKHNATLIVLFCLVPVFETATIRQYEFMIKGLIEVEAKLKQKNIPFYVLAGDPTIEIPNFINDNKTAVLVTDFNPLRLIRKWKEEVSKSISIPFYEVDAHNIVPCRIASNKQEFAAYTIRPKITNVLDKYLEDFPDVLFQKEEVKLVSNEWAKLRGTLKVDKTVPELDWLIPGEDAALNALRSFIEKRFEFYANGRNDPTLDQTSNLSPYFHFGQLAPQRAGLMVDPFIQHSESRKAFLEELIVRRELADNFCFYNENYDNIEGIHEWAKATVEKHRKDEREYLYSPQEFEQAKTHDDLWNAAQTEMVTKGKMHGYMRMYWAKKILEWTKSPEEAYKTAIYLNDKYQLDGRDPNGYTGIAWSIGGVHDRAWSERPVFGKIRYMNYNGCKRKFDIKTYIKINSPGIAE